MDALIAIVMIIMIITFFVMALRLGKIMDSLKIMEKFERNKPENQTELTCEKCNEKVSVSILRKGELVDCPKCKNLIRVKV